MNVSLRLISCPSNWFAFVVERVITQAGKIPGNSSSKAVMVRVNGTFSHDEAGVSDNLVAS